jgi:hypothetical protein
MSLAEHLESMQRAFLGPEPTDEELGRIGDPSRLRIYRSMVRARLTEVSKNAFKRTFAALGEEDALSIVARFLDEDGPRTRYFWRVPVELFDRLVTSIPEGAPPFARDLARFEITRWTLRHGPFPTPAEHTSLSFERPPVLNPAHALLTVGHRVDVRGEEHVEEERRLCLHRGPDHKVTVQVLNTTSEALVREWQREELTLTESVKRITERDGLEITERFIERLSSLLETFLAQGLLLGSKAG